MNKYAISVNQKASSNKIDTFNCSAENSGKKVKEKRKQFNVWKVFKILGATLWINFLKARSKTIFQEECKLWNLVKGNIMVEYTNSYWGKPIPTIERL